MTWYCNGKEVPYDFYGEKAQNDVWWFLCEEYGSPMVALTHLIRETPGGVEYFADLLSRIHMNPDSDGLEVQAAVDEFIWDNTMLHSDDAMRESGSKKVTIAGLTFKWVDPWKEGAKSERKSFRGRGNR